MFFTTIEMVSTANHGGHILQGYAIRVAKSIGKFHGNPWYNRQNLGNFMQISRTIFFQNQKYDEIF